MRRGPRTGHVLQEAWLSVDDDHAAQRHLERLLLLVPDDASQLDDLLHALHALRAHRQEKLSKCALCGRLYRIHRVEG